MKMKFIDKVSYIQISQNLTAAKNNRRIWKIKRVKRKLIPVVTINY